MERLHQILRRIDGRGYKAYKDIRGRYDLDGYILCVDRVQGDPFAAPSQLRVVLEPDFAGFDEQDYQNRDRCTALEDFLTRSFARALRRRPSRRAGSGKSGRLEVVRCGQEILERTSCSVSRSGELTFRFTLGLPAAGRRILGREAWEILSGDIPRLVEDALRCRALDSGEIEHHLNTAEDQRELRRGLRSAGLVAFLADGSLLPRASGASDEPASSRVVPLEAPDSMAVTLEAPHRGEVRGLGIARGVTLVVGGGYHGKSTVLNAIARGVYDHVPNDGRDYCVTDLDACVIRAEDGRSISGVDIRAFIGDLPLGKTTKEFSTPDAAGSTSQAAAIMEALEVGAEVLLIDEDTAATNFMIRDRRMRKLVPDDKEPITPFIDRVQQLSDLGVSTVLVVGGAGDYLDVADAVICMEEYRPRNVSDEARAVAREIPARDEGASDLPPFPESAPRVPERGSLDPRKGRRPERVKAVRTRDILFGEQEIDVSLVEQLVDPAQARAVGDALLYVARDLADGERSLSDILDAVEERLDDRGLASLLPLPAGDRARVRCHELAAALNRLRTLRVR